MRTALYRSLLFVPGNSERFLAKAQNVRADIVCLDLEDSVRADDKADARRLVRTALRSKYDARVFVRTNAPGTADIRKDLSGVIRRGIEGVVIPKVDNAAQLRSIIRSITSLERKHGVKQLEIIPSIETASGVVSCAQIASASTRVRAVVFGIFDLLHDMHMEGSETAGGEHARNIIPLHARAGGAVAIDSIWQNLRSRAGLTRDCKHARSLGYAGKSVIHPDQLPTVHAAFAPSREDVAWAKRVCAAYEGAAASRRGSLRLDGKMIDEVHYKQARALLD